MTRKELLLLDPATQPVRELVSAMDQSSLGPGQWAQLDNVRVKRGVIQCRGGTSAALGTVGTGTFRGKWEGYLWGAYCMVVALETGGAVKILRSTDLASWTEITASSGKYGNTRMTAGYMVRFTVAPRTFGTEGGAGSILIAVNGVDDARAFNSASGCIVTDINPPLAVQDKPVFVDIIQGAFYLNIQAIVGGDLSATGAGISWAASGSSPNLQARLSITSGVTNGSTATITRTISNVTATVLDRQLIIGVDSAYAPLWDKLKLQLGGTTIWDPTSASSYTRPVGIPIDNTQKTLWVFNFPKLSGTTNLTTLVLTWVAATTEAPSSTQTADFFLVGLTYGGGLAKADSAIAVSHCNSGSGTESPGVVYSSYQTERISDVGGPILNNIRLPRSSKLNAVFSAPLVGVSNTERDAGVDRANFYIKETGSSRYRYFYTWQMNTWGGASWSNVSPSAADAVAWVTAGPDTYTVIYPDVDMPSAFNKAIPTDCKEACYANNRLILGKDTTQNLIISEYKLPFRTTIVPRFENGRPAEQSGIYLSLEGETVQAVVPIAASTAGSSTIFVFTDQNVYAIAGQSTSQLSQIGRVAGIGTLSPLSISTDKGSVFFVDNDMQCRVIEGGSMSSVTRDKVDDKLAAIPGARRKWISAATFDDFHYLAYTVSSTNEKILVFDLGSGLWVTDTPPKSMEALSAWFDGTNLKRRLIGLGIDGSDLKVYEYDLSTQSQDLATTNITATLEPYELHLPDGGMFHVGRCRAMIDDVNSASATIVRTYQPSGIYQTTSLSLDVANEHIYREDRIEGATVTGSGQPVGPRCRVTFSIPLTSGKRIRYLSLEATPLGGGHDRP